MRKFLFGGFIVLALIFYGCEKEGTEPKEVPTDGTSWEIVHSDESIMPTIFTGDIISGSQFIVLGGDKGFLAISNDNGASWNTSTVGSMADSGYSIRSIAFADDQRGVLGGDLCIYRTTDGGQNWILSADQTSLGEVRVRKVKYMGSGIFYAIAGNNFLKSSDYGENWTIIPISELDSTAYGLMSFDFVDIDNGFMISSGPYAFRTTDGGDTWTEEDMDICFNAYDVDATDDGIYYVCGDTGNIAYREGENLWTTVNSGISSDSTSLYIFVSIDITGSLGIAVGNCGMVTISTDGGATWSVTNALSIYGDVEYAEIASNGDALVVANDPIRGGGTARIGTNNLSTWEGISYGSLAEFDDIAILNDNEAILVGKQTSIYKTYDGGNTLYQRVVDFPTDITISGVDFWNETNGIAVGTDGKILLTVDGGEIWSFVDSSNISTDNSIDHLNKIEYVNENTAYAVGLDDAFNGIFLKTTDGGNSWEGTGVGVSADILGLDFIDENNGWIVGDIGTILRTTDGGNTWTQQTSGTNSALTGVSFVDANNGWICGTFAILSTTDGGAHWSSAQIEDELFAHFRDIVFIDSQTGWIVGNFGYILHTVDGGNTWYRQAAGMTEDNLYAIDVLDLSNILACGERGIIMHLLP